MSTVVRSLACAAGLLVVLPFPVVAQDNAAASAARSWHQQHERAILDTASS